jgi:sialic acid synthase SpsE
MLKKLELSFDDFLFLAEYCAKIKIEFLSTAFDDYRSGKLIRLRRWASVIS